MRKIAFFLLFCIVALATGCPKSTPKQPIAFNRLAGDQTDFLKEFDNEIDKYNCLMSGRNWSEYSETPAEQQTQQDLAQKRKREREIVKKLDALKPEIGDTQSDIERNEDNYLTEKERLERERFTAQQQEAAIAQKRQEIMLLEAQLKKTPAKQKTLRAELQGQIARLRQEIALAPSLRDSNEILLDLEILQRRYETYANRLAASQQKLAAQQTKLETELAQNQAEQKPLTDTLRDLRNNSIKNQRSQRDQDIPPICLSTGNETGRPSEEQRAAARKVRDNLLYQLIRLTDYQYFQFENDLYVKKSSASFLADALEIGGNFAGTITNGARAKTIIHAALIGFQSTRKAANISYFQEQTADVLITKMQTSRNRVLTDILEQIEKQDVDSYPLDAALGDAIKYFYAGTLPRALQELKKDAGVAAENAENNLREVKGITVRTPATIEQRKLSVDTFEFLNSLAKTLASDTASEGAKTEARGKLLKIAEQIKKNTNITDELNKDEELKKLLEDLTTNSGNGIELANTLLSLRSGRGGKPNEATLKAIDTIIVNIDNTK